MLHKQNPVPATLTPSEKPLSGPVPINMHMTQSVSQAAVPTPVPPPRTDFQPVLNPSMATSQAPVFSG